MYFRLISHQDFLVVFHYTWRAPQTSSHYTDVIMTTIASQINSLTVVYSVVYSGADQRKHQSSAALAFVRGIHRDRWIPRTNGQLRGKCFHLMTSSCPNEFSWRSIFADGAPMMPDLQCNLCNLCKLADVSIALIPGRHLIPSTSCTTWFKLFASAKMRCHEISSEELVEKWTRPEISLHET